MILKTLNPGQYKRFFAFGCSFTNYVWPTWADIIAQDIPFYENWGHQAAGNEFIFNSVIEADIRHKFTKDDLIIIMWSSTSREDRYVNNQWKHATIDQQADVYGSQWVRKFSTDTRTHLIHDYAYIKSIQDLLDSKDCTWVNLVMHPIAKNIYSDNLAKKLNIVSELDKRTYWYNSWNTLCSGNYTNDFFEVFEDSDIISLYQDIFKNIQASYECVETFTKRDFKSTPIVDGRINTHPTPQQALAFLDLVWPNNTLSDQAREYTAYWDQQIYLNTDWSKPIHEIKDVSRL